jgi:DNA-binding SARP family transcriptional activator
VARTYSRERNGAIKGEVEFRLLGPLEVVHEGGTLPLGGQKQRALLAVLLLRAGEVVATDRLIDDLWGEQPPRTAATSLQNLVSQLRKMLGPDAVVTKPPGYQLAIPADRVDLVRFERLVRAARGAPADERAAKLREALALWRGPPLLDLAYEPFAQSEIRRLEELRLSALEERIEADLELERHAELVGELEGLVSAHPLRERLRGQLMLALYRSGRQAEALKAYHDARRALVDELGIEPSPALQQLHGSILRQESTLAPAAPRSVEDHHGEVVRAILAGRLVPVLGPAAVSPGLPTPTSVAAKLAELFEAPGGHDSDLTRVSQYVALTQGVGPLYDELHSLLGVQCEPSPVHRSLAQLASLLRRRDLPRQLIVTTAFDDALERAFAEADEEFDVLSYLSSGRHRGKFLHLKADGDVRVIDVPNAYSDVAPGERTVILKVHGQVDAAPSREWESFVVSEDDYIDYLAQTDLANVVPVLLAAKLRRSHFLFLGYALQQWSLRVFLHRVWGQEKVGYRSWAVQPEADALDREFWRHRGIDLFDVPLDEYAQGLVARVDVNAEAVAA